MNQSDENSDKLIIDHDEEKLNKNNLHLNKQPSYSFNTTIQTPLIPNKSNDDDDDDDRSPNS
ncbi:unnamed protein product, partial [Rotaria magnacalcarata]